MRVQELAKEQEAYVIACRRHLHEHPELSTQEVETTKFIKAELTKMGIPVQEFDGITGCVGTIEGTMPGKTVMLARGHRCAPDPGKSGEIILQQKSGRDACLRS